jgi:hypothetical protein
MFLIAVGALFAVGWFFVAWRTQSDLNSSTQSFSATGALENPDFVDRVVAVEQIGFLLLFALLTVGGGCGLHLYASRLIATRDR